MKNRYGARNGKPKRIIDRALERILFRVRREREKRLGPRNIYDAGYSLVLTNIIMSPASPAIVFDTSLNHIHIPP